MGVTFHFLITGQFLWESYTTAASACQAEFGERLLPVRLPPRAVDIANRDIRGGTQSDSVSIQGVDQSALKAQVKCSSAMRVVFASRASSHVHAGRTVLNKADLLQRCNALQLPSSSVFTSVLCFPHVFGDDLLFDLWLMVRAGYRRMRAAIISAAPECVCFPLLFAAPG
jgi:hypothetical protein